MKGNDIFGVFFFWIFFCIVFGGGGGGLRMCIMMCCALMCLNVFSLFRNVDIKEKTYPNDLCIFLHNEVYDWLN